MFKKEVYDLVDKKSKEAIVKYLISKGIKAEAVEDYRIDIRVDGEPYAECECRSNSWVGNKFIFPSVHIPKRKEKILQKSIYYFVLNKDFTHALCCHSSIIRAHELKEVPNTRYKSGEFFYDIPINRWHLINLQSKETNVLQIF
jgi:hypothetical protein